MTPRRCNLRAGMSRRGTRTTSMPSWRFTPNPLSWCRRWPKPFAAQRRCAGLEHLREYFAQGLKKYPDLRFDLVHTFLCESSVTTVYYGPVGNLVAEVMLLGKDGKIERVHAHYLCAPADKCAS